MHKKSVQEKSKYRPGNSFTPMVKCNPLSDAKGMLVPPPNMEREKAMIFDAAMKVEKHSQSMENIRIVGENSYNQGSANLSGGLNLSFIMIILLNFKFFIPHFRHDPKILTKTANRHFLLAFSLNKNERTRPI